MTERRRTIADYPLAEKRPDLVRTAPAKDAGRYHIGRN